MGRIWIENGKLIQTAEISPSSLSCADSCYVAASLEIQTFDEKGAENTGSYRGPGVVLRNDATGKLRVVLGDSSNPEATLTEYQLADDPTPESLTVYDAIKSGVEAATGLKPKRRVTSKGADWLYGFDEAKKCCRRK